MTPLMYVLNMLGKTAYSPVMPESIFKMILRLLFRIFGRLRIVRHHMNVPAPGSLNYDIMMEIYFTIAISLYIVSYWWLPNVSNARFSVLCSRDLITGFLLGFVLLRTFEMVVRKVRAGLSG